MWGDISLHDVPPKATVIFLRENSHFTKRALVWFEVAHNKVVQFYETGARRDIAGMAVGCHGEETLLPWWSHAVGPLNTTCAFSPIRPDWEFFVEWYKARRREWVSWPHVWNFNSAVPVFWKGKNKNKRDRQLIAFGKMAGTDYSYVGDKYLLWERWFPRWAANHSLRVCTAETDLGINGGHPNPPVIAKSAQEFIVSTSYGDVISLGTVWYEPVDQQFGRGYFEALKKIVGDMPKMVSVTIINSQFMQLTRSWLCNVRTAGFLPPNIYWIVLDHKAKTELDRLGVGKTVDITDAFTTDNMHSMNILYGQPAYWKLMLMRTRLIRDLLDRGIDVFLFETDQVWLQNPIDYIKREINADADMVGTLDTQHNIAGNIVMLRSVLPTRRLWSEVYLRFKVSYDMKNVESKEIHSSTFVQHDQYQLSDLLLYNTKFTQDFPVALGLLNSELFVGGSWYSGMYSSKVSKRPIIINNNFISGTERKKTRAIVFGHWFLKDDNQTCDVSTVQNVLRYEFKRMPGKWWLGARISGRYHI